MGQYLNPPGCTAKDKVTVLKELGAVEVPLPKWKDVPKGKFLICVGDRVVFQFAAVVYDEREYVECTQHVSCPTRWFLLDVDVVNAQQLN